MNVNSPGAGQWDKSTVLRHFWFDFVIIAGLLISVISEKPLRHRYDPPPDMHWEMMKGVAIYAWIGNL